MEMQSQFGTIIGAIKEKRPVIHHITNYVTVESCANICLAAGASPIMAHAVEEVADITKNADALVINIGTLDAAKAQAMEIAAAAAKVRGIPVVLDPVGVMATTYRLNFALKLLKTGAISIVRGNYDECKALYDAKAEGRGVDSGEAEDAGEPLRLAKDAAAKYNCVFAITGATDYVSDGKRGLVLNGGHPLLKSITGAGCMTSTLCAVCATATMDYLAAAVLGIVIMGQAAELAASFLETKDGPGMFRVRLIDCVYHVTDKWNLINLKPEERQN